MVRRRKLPDRQYLTNAAFDVLHVMWKEGATIKAHRTFPHPHHFLVKKPAQETGNTETNANIISDLLMNRFIEVTKHDERFDNIEYAITEKGQRSAALGGEITGPAADRVIW